MRKFSFFTNRIQNLSFFAGRKYYPSCRRNHLFTYKSVGSRFFSDTSPTKVYSVNFSPEIIPGSNIIVPISMGIYGMSNRAGQEEYDAKLRALFIETAKLLESGEVEEVAVISSADLHRIQWSDELVSEVEKKFFNKHKKFLEKQTSFSTWNNWIDQQGREFFKKLYEEVKEKSAEGTEWYNLMVSTHERVKMSSDLEQSLEYQRMEYAVILMMSRYQHIAYTGNITLAWSYMYYLFQDRSLPVFTRACFNKWSNQPAKISTSDANHTVNLIMKMIEDTLISKNFPNKQKRNLIDGMKSLLYLHDYKGKSLCKKHHQINLTNNCF